MVTYVIDGVGLGMYEKLCCNKQSLKLDINMTNSIFHTGENDQELSMVYPIASFALQLRVADFLPLRVKLSQSTSSFIFRKCQTSYTDGLDLEYASFVLP